MSEAASADKPRPGAGLVGAACAAAQPLVPVPVPSTNTSAMQFFAPDPSDDRDSVSVLYCFFNFDADCFPALSSVSLVVGCIAMIALPYWLLDRDGIDLFLYILMYICVINIIVCSNKHPSAFFTTDATSS